MVDSGAASSTKDAGAIPTCHCELRPQKKEEEEEEEEEKKGIKSGEKVEKMMEDTLFFSKGTGEEVILKKRRATRDLWKRGQSLHRKDGL